MQTTGGCIPASNDAGALAPRGRTRNAARPRGAVLLLVIGAVALLSILAFEVAHHTRLDITRSSRGRREAAFRRAFSSGMELGQALIIEKSANPAFDYWSGWQKRTSARLSADVSIDVQVADESGKLSLQPLLAQSRDSGATRKRLKRIFDHLRTVEPERETAWNQAESGIDSRLAMGVPVFTLDGLREAGIPLDVVFRSTTEGGFRPREIVLSDVLTVFGGDKLNINTAHDAVLYALDDEFNQVIVENIVAWRGEKDDGRTAEHRPFEAPVDLELVDGIVQRAIVDGEPVVTRNLYRKVARSIDVRSTCFSICVDAEVDGRSRQACGFFEATRHGPNKRIQLKRMAYEEIEP